MIRVTDLKLDVESLGTDFLLAEVMPNYLYDKETNKRTDTVVGYKYSVVVLKHRMEKIIVKIDGKESLFEGAEEEYPISVVFDGLELGMYQDFKTKEIKITASARGISRGA